MNESTRSRPVMIRFEDVGYRYANTATDAVTGINLTVREGELKLVTGASGCGKTTLMRLANGLCPQVYGGQITGSVTVAGRNVAQTPVAELSEVIGTLFQDPEEQFFALSVGDEIAFALRSRGIAPGAVDVRVEAAARRVGITQLLARDIHALSEGQKQKVGLADILALGPRVLILDEPSANLDPEATEALARTLIELKNAGCAILVVDHRLYWLAEAADEVLVMSRGRIQKRGPFAMLSDDGLRTRWGLRRNAVADVRKTLPRVPVTNGSGPEQGGQPAEDCVFVASGMTFHYTPQEPIFEEVGFAVAPGITALIGDNGTGKTTLARILTGLNIAKAGRFFVRARTSQAQNGGRAGTGPAAPTATAACNDLMPYTGLVLQNADHQLQMASLRDEVAGAVLARRTAQLRKGSPWWGKLRKARLAAGDHDEIERILTELHLSHLAHRHPQSLSGGEKQRAVIACALAKDPAILILDEPTSGLDGANMAAIAALLKREAARGRAVFLITHDLELLAVCDRALDMRDLNASGRRQIEPTPAPAIPGQPVPDRARQQQLGCGATL